MPLPILESLYFFLPAYAARALFLLFPYLPGGKRKIHPQYSLTMAHIYLSVMGSTIIFVLQQLLYRIGFQSLALIDYPDFSFLLGTMMGLGVVAGSFATEYYRRKDGIPAVERWFPWDQWGYCLGAVIFSFFFYVPDVLVVVVFLIATPLFHLLGEFVFSQKNQKNIK